MGYSKEFSPKNCNLVFAQTNITIAKIQKLNLPDSRTYGLTFKKVLLIDSTTIRLFSDILKGVGRNPKGGG
jgi:hypothetical protein